MVDDMEHLRREYENLSERHTQYVEDYGPDGEVAHQGKLYVCFICACSHHRAQILILRCDYVLNLK